MPDQWYYLCQWKESSLRNWVIVDMESKSIIEKNLTKQEANLKNYDYHDKNKKTLVVNIKDKYYNLYRKNTEEK